VEICDDEIADQMKDKDKDEVNDRNENDEDKKFGQN